MSRRNKPADALETKKKKVSAEKIDPKKLKRTGRLLQTIWMFTIMLLLLPLIYGFIFQKSESNEASHSKITFYSWFSGSYQEQQERHSKKNWAFANFFSRLNNQIDYSLLNKVNIAGFVKGKDNQLYETDYIKAYLGQDYIGEDSIRAMLVKLKVVADSLKQKNIDIMIVYAPGKPTFSPEYLPSGYGEPTGTTNLQTFIKVSNELGLNYIDMQDWFLSMKSKQRYPLFPSYGLHWSYWGECLAEDSIVHYIERLRNRRLPSWKYVEPVLNVYQMRDADVIGQLKLFWIPPTPLLAYPKIGLVKNSSINTCRVLGIADSYYFGFNYDELQKYVFDHGEYWRYYNTIVSDTDNGQGNQNKEVWEIDLRQELEKNQVIILMASDRNLTNFGWGFIQDAYLMYTNPPAYESLRKQRDLINPYKKEIRLDKDLMDELTIESQQKNIPIDTLITRRAKEKMESENPALKIQ